MSQATPVPSTNPSRRLFIAAGPASVVFSALGAAVNTERLEQLISAHRDLYHQFSDACGFEDDVDDNDPRFQALRAEWLRLSNEEDAALTTLLEHPVSTINEARRKASYIMAHFERGAPQGEHLMQFLSALAA